MTTQSLFFTVMSLFFSFYGLCYGQEDTIRLINPSFEDLPRTAKPPRGWYDCGFDQETPPDVQPSGQFEVMRPANHGATYLGMVVRDNDTWERVSQRLTIPIKGNICYSFSLDLCRSELYVSRSRIKDVPANYVTPVKLIIWGGDDYCGKKERLAESSLISNTQWKPYNFKLEPKQTHTYIMLEAFYKTPVLFPYNGNVLVDNASPIISIPCDEEPVFAKIPTINFTTPSGRSVRVYDREFTVKAKVENIKNQSEITFKVNGKANDDFVFDIENGVISAAVSKFKKGRNDISVRVTNEAGSVEDQAILIYEPEESIAAHIPKTPDTYEVPAEITPPKKNKKIEGFSREELKAGQSIKISELSFKMNDSTINQTAFPPLGGIYEFLKENTDVVVEIGGHTSGLCEAIFCNQLSTARARAVAEYLESRGVQKQQLKYKGYGKTKPIASNRTAIGRKKNQRVEIKILRING